MTHFLLIPGAETVTTPFEDWCESMGVHPEALGAWEMFSRRSAVHSTPDAIIA